MKYLVIIPTYNEKENIRKIIPEVLAQSEEIDILVVDDSSPDKTYEIVSKISEENNRVHLLLRAKKEGLGAAYMAGFAWALKRGYDFIISMDADFSHQPKYLKNMVKAEKEIDVLDGSRYVKGGGIKGWNWKRQFNSRGANFFTHLALGLKTHDVTAGFKRYSRRFLESLDFKNFISSGYAFHVEMVMKAERRGFITQEFPIIFIDRRAGESKIEGELMKSIKVVLRLAWQREGLRQFIKFAVVGASATIVDWLAFFGLSRFLMTGFFSGQTLKQISKGLSFIISATANYITNRKWTFRSRDQHIATQALKFYLVATAGLIFNNLIFYFVTKILSWRDIWGLFFATGIVLFWNFFANKKWTFKK
ncbi:MAG: dolichol-phosphate mannosyltransferase [Candidatus Berkelbacteria bacterium Licking1014_7]|uniref:Dolichol-phosphate mannosyltransferase n=1 Tax=Candidatus Berkelbacteria bacterium Licking1014_7 TaxID=2017147 RepID=A0A554LJS8_9BACT|nr:MAG: dolichol-phosphate mannosyltransferase [Candidatus Berkelbacteria bacterium Licking1014_7]